jgi:hypothetical protein
VFPELLFGFVMPRYEEVIALSAIQDAVKAAAAKLGLRPSKLVMVGDTPYDARPRVAQALRPWVC